jgi:hypothetical protein
MGEYSTQNEIGSRQKAPILFLDGSLLFAPGSDIIGSLTEEE